MSSDLNGDRLREAANVLRGRIVFVEEKPWAVSDPNIEKIRFGPTTHFQHFNLANNVRRAVQSLFPTLQASWERQLTDGDGFFRRLQSAWYSLIMTWSDLPDNGISRAGEEFPIAWAHWSEHADFIATMDPLLAEDLAYLLDSLAWYLDEGFDDNWPPFGTAFKIADKILSKENRDYYPL